MTAVTPKVVFVAARQQALVGATIAVLAILALLSLGCQPSQDPPAAVADVEFVTSAACVECHKEQYEKWLGSDHDLAMAEATEATVLGDFDDAEYTYDGVTSRFYRRDGKYFIFTEGPDGELAEFPVAYVFGHEPLQQYLVPFPGGRLQASRLAWDTQRQRWFHMYPETKIPPGDWLHWTRNGQNWNGMCAECHSTHLEKGYDPATDTYQTSWTDIDVGCEACHGPGSRHVEWAKIPPEARPDLPQTGLVTPTRDLDGPRFVQLCAPCHSRRAEIGDYDHRGGELLDTLLPSLLQEGLYHPDGQILDEVYVYGSFLQSKMYANGVRCADCHDSHSLQLKAEGNALCRQCHAAWFDSTEHHFHQQVVDGQPSDGALCVKCHMVEQPYMVIDWRADHSFRVPRPDLSAEIGTPNACSQSGCHDDRPLQWAIDAVRKWYPGSQRPHYGPVFAAAREGVPGISPELARIADAPLQPVIVRATALEHLAGIGDETSRIPLEAALKSRDPLLRRTAVAGLVERDPARRADLLAPLLSDSVKAVRMAAASQLAGIDPELLTPARRDDLARGIEEYEQSMLRSLDFASSSLNLGNLYGRLGEPLAAERSYRRALTVDSLFLPAKMNLAILLSSQGRNDEAASLLREAAAEYPQNGEVANALGLLLVEMDRLDEALPWMRQAAQSNPRSTRVRYNLGLLLQQSGHADEAEIVFRQALDIDPEALDVQYALAVLLANQRRWDEADALVARMVAAYPDEPAVLDLRRRLAQSRR